MTLKPDDLRKIGENHYVYAEMSCQSHGSHFLTGRGDSKQATQSIIKAVVDDVHFYNDKCPKGSIKGVYTAWQEVFRKYNAITEKATTVFGVLNRVDKTVMTKAAR